MAKYLFILLFSLPAYGSIESLVSCADSASYFERSTSTLWSYVSREPGSRAKDSVYSVWDFAKPYSDIMKRLPYKPDRTKGVFLELRDRFNYAYQLSRYQQWRDYRIYSQLDQTERDFRSLEWCYGGGDREKLLDRHF